MAIQNQYMGPPTSGGSLVIDPKTAQTGGAKPEKPQTGGVKPPKPTGGPMMMPGPGASGGGMTVDPTNKGTFVPPPANFNPAGGTGAANPNPPPGFGGRRKRGEVTMGPGAMGGTQNPYGPGPMMAPPGTGGIKPERGPEMMANSVPPGAGPMMAPSASVPPPPEAAAAPPPPILQAAGTGKVETLEAPADQRPLPMGSTPPMRYPNMFGGAQASEAEALNELAPALKALKGRLQGGGGGLGF